jgi:hypothetical protein
MVSKDFCFEESGNITIGIHPHKRIAMLLPHLEMRFAISVTIMRFVASIDRTSRAASKFVVVLSAPVAPVGVLAAIWDRA